MRSDATVGEMMRRCLKDFGFVPPVKQALGSDKYTIAAYVFGEQYERKSDSLEMLLAEFYNWAASLKAKQLHQQLIELKAMAEQEELAEKFHNQRPLLAERIAS